jgi:hypothetical protein
MMGQLAIIDMHLEQSKFTEDIYSTEWKNFSAKFAWNGSKKILDYNFHLSLYCQRCILMKAHKM